MEIGQLIAALSYPRAYSHKVEQIQVFQTHISAVFLAGPYAYKVKKPVKFDFVDFSTLERRRFFCEEEVRLNHRLAGSVYHGVVPITREGQGLRMGGQGEAIEWAVQMDRLPAEQTLAEFLQKGQASPDLVCLVARRIAAFHMKASSGAETASFGQYDVINGNARENLKQARSQIGHAISASVLKRLQSLTAATLERLRPLIERRAHSGVPRDTHGDLRLDHVYFFPDRPPPNDLIIIDCIEFNERFRFADPVNDMAFLVMDLIAHGRRDLADVFAETYFHAARDDEGRALLPFYTSYRAAVRAKVACIKANEPEISDADRTEALAKARARWLLALAELEEPGCKPCLILVGGLPGSGKSTLSRGLTDKANAQVIRSDVVRKELAGVDRNAPGRAGFEGGIYTSEWTERTYAECLRRADALLFEGSRVIVDANFGKEIWRQMFMELAKWWSAPMLFLLCRTTPDVVKVRLASRQNDVSDADWSVHVQAAARWEEPSEQTRAVLREISTNCTAEEGLAKALRELRSLKLCD